jgi:hypothetical protein
MTCTVCLAIGNLEKPHVIIGENVGDWQIGVAGRAVVALKLCHVASQVVLPTQVVGPRKVADLLVLVELLVLGELERPAPPQVPSTLVCPLKSCPLPGVAHAIAARAVDLEEELVGAGVFPRRVLPRIVVQ